MSQTSFDFTDHVVIVTGAAGNLGQSVARAFYDAGANLTLVDRAQDRLPHLYPDLADSPDHFLATSVDLTDVEAVEGMVAGAIDRFGRIDSLINAAGGYRAGVPVHELSLADWDFMLNLNARTVLILSRAVAPHMIRQQRGRIVNVAARAALKGGAGMAAYSASKSAVVRLTESMGAELREEGINVNCVLPSALDTPQNRQAMPQADFSQWLSPAALADIILFLASDAARALHGAAITV